MNQMRTMVAAGRASCRRSRSARRLPVVQSCSKSSVKAGRQVVDSTIATTFSCTEKESFVQFIEPVQTVSPSRTTYLWCMRSGTPAIGAHDAERRDQLPSGSGGGGTGIGLRWPRS